MTFFVGQVSDMDRRIFFGDNLETMREHISDEYANLVYLDPPFNSDARYNVLFTTPDEEIATAQAEAFKDTWFWDQEAEWAFQQCVASGGPVASIVNALYAALGRCDLMAYLVMMAVRLSELHRILKPSGSLFLHCDPTASHYLKIVLDGIFGADNFRNELIWRRNHAKGLATRRLPTNHDTLLIYSKGTDNYWNVDEAFLPYDENDLPEKTLQQYSRKDPLGRRYQLTSLLNPNKNRPNLEYEFLGIKRVWRWTKDRMHEALDEGLIHQSGPGKVPRFKRFLDEQRGLPLDDIWSDIPRLNPTDAERTGYPTQKPVALLDRIIRLACPNDGLVFDPFCGCGTTVQAAQGLRRAWVGCDIAIHGIELIRDRLRREYSLHADEDYELHGTPTDLAGAIHLAERDKFQFQWWANHLVGVQQMREVKKGRDQGIDGEMWFHAGPDKGYGRILTSVKGGQNVGPSDVRDFLWVLEREEVAGGLFICLRRPTRDMRTNAAGAGFFNIGRTRYPRLQIVSLEEWFIDRVQPDIPPLVKLEKSAKTWMRRTKGQRKPKDSAQKSFLFEFPNTASDEDTVVHLNPRTAFSDEGTGLTG